MNGLTIGTVAQQAGVNIETLRYYERKGIIPKPLRTSSNYRLYSKGLFRVLSGRRSQIEFPTVEVDGVDEVLLIAETARRGLDPLNP